LIAVTKRGDRRELQVLFSREPQSEPDRAVPLAPAFALQVLPGVTTTVVAANAARPEPIVLRLILRYPAP